MSKMHSLHVTFHGDDTVHLISIEYDESGRVTSHGKFPVSLVNSWKVWATKGLLETPDFCSQNVFCTGSIQRARLLERLEMEDSSKFLVGCSVKMTRVQQLEFHADDRVLVMSPTGFSMCIPAVDKDSWDDSSYRIFCVTMHIAAVKGEGRKNDEIPCLVRSPVPDHSRLLRIQSILHSVERARETIRANPI
jgi:hypothetical protein